MSRIFLICILSFFSLFTLHAEEEGVISLKENSYNTQRAQAEEVTHQTISIDLKQVFSGAPIIYSILLSMSVGTLFIWLYSILTLRSIGHIPDVISKSLRTKIHGGQYDEALSLCSNHNSLFCRMLQSALLVRTQGPGVMSEAMKAEGKRASVVFWQRLALLNDIAVIAPMLGLLGTVVGMFYAFYDLNRTIESISTLFDGLGISVGTTVAGLGVSILSMILYSVSKYRLVQQLTLVDNETQAMASLIHKAPTQGEL